MSLVKTGLLNGIAVVVRVVSGLLLNKILAIYVGPSGYAVIGIFQNSVTIIVNLAGGVIANGVTKYTAEHQNNELKQHAVWRTAMKLSLYASAVVAVFIFILRDWLSEELLYSHDLPNLFIWLAFTLPAMAVNTILVAIINGKKKVWTYVILNIIGSITGLIFISSLSYFYGLYGALIAFTISPAVVLLSTIILLYRQDWIKIKYFYGNLDSPVTKKLLNFGLMGVISSITMPLALIIIRDQLVATLGMESAGYWQACWKISEMYLMLITSTLAVYYLPRIAEIKDPNELGIEIIKVYKVVLPVAIIGAIMIFIMKDYFIEILFTDKFLPMRELFGWQLFGDVLKIGSWILSYVMLGRAMVKFYIATEIIFSALFIFLSFILIKKIDLIGVPIAYCINYIFYWICMGLIVKYDIKKMIVVK
jgi:PST family polysaccharide transporter